MSLKFKNTKVAFLEESIIRSGLPMTTKEPIDFYNDLGSIEDYVDERDLIRINKLSNVKPGTGHDNFMKGIIVQFDLQYPEYFSSQLQRYNWVDIISSQSKMHKLVHVKDIENRFNKYVFQESVIRIQDLLYVYNKDEFPIEYQTDGKLDKFIIKDKQECFNYIISNLPSGYLKWMGISTNYLQLKTIYNQRKNHKLSEWREFCSWIEELPMSELITGKV